MNKLGFLGTLCLLCIAIASPLSAQEGSEGVMSRQETLTLDLVATISAINPETREVELQDGQGNTRTVVAGPRVQRFDELEVGDEVHATIEITALAELRSPTEEEIASLGEAKLGVVRSGQDGPLAGGLAESTTSVVMVVGLSLLGNIITVVTVDGDLIDVQAQSEENIKQLRLGDTIVVTYSAAIVASVVPVGGSDE